MAKKNKPATQSAEAAAVSPATIPEPAPVSIAGLAQPSRAIEITQIIDDEDANRLRSADDAQNLSQLEDSMRLWGQLQPIVVEELELEVGDVVPMFAVVCGRRRLSAARNLGWTSLNAIVVKGLSAAQRQTVIATENLQRDNLTPGEEAVAVLELCIKRAGIRAVQAGSASQDDGSTKLRKAALQELDVRDVREQVIAQVASELAKPATWVRDRLYLRRLPESVLQMVHQGLLPLGHAREIAKLDPHAESEQQVRLASDFRVGGPEGEGDHLPGSIEDLRREVGRRVFALADVPWRLDVDFAEAPACASCPHNTANDYTLFEHGGVASLEMKAGLGSEYNVVDAVKASTKAGVCTSPSCYQRKLSAAKAERTKLAAKALAAAEDGPKKTMVERALKHLPAPSIVKPRDLRDYVEKRAESRSAPSAAKSSKADSERAAKEEQERAARREAERKLSDAMHEWEKLANTAVEARVLKTPLLFASIRVLQHVPTFKACDTYNEKARQKALASRELAAAFKLVAEATVDSLQKLEQSSHRRFEYMPQDHYASCELLNMLVAALKVEVPPMPTIENFLAAPATAQPDDKKSKKGGQR